MDAHNHTRSRARTRTRSPLQVREAFLAGEPLSRTQQCTVTPVLLLKDSSEPRQIAKASCLYVRSGSEYLPASTDVILGHVREWATRRHHPHTEMLDCPRAIQCFLLAELASRENEVVAILLLDGKLRFIDYVELAQGTRENAPIPLREIIRLAIKHDARGVVLAHNHPSGRAEPSYADIMATQWVKTALEM